MRLRLVTWNVNSIRAHLETVGRFVAERQPDILCLQETKVTDAEFPLKALHAMGFRHHALHGQKNWHGVAVFSRDVPFETPARQAWCGKEDARHVSVMLPGGVELHNFYVPAGGDVPDPEANLKFAHKLEFLRQTAAHFAARRAEDARILLVGDLNVAPLETDVWSHRQLLGVVSHTPVEVELLGRWQASLDWIDAVRRFIPPEEKLYSWWSYRARDWEASDRGRRLDHVWATPALAEALASATVHRAVRGWRPATDHVPVEVELEI